MPYLADASLIVRWTLSRTSCYLEKPERKDIKQVTEICFFHFYFVHNTGANFISCSKHNTNTTQPCRILLHTLILSFVMAVSFIKNISLKVYLSKWETYLMYWNDVFKLWGIVCLWIITFRTIFIICKHSLQTTENRFVFSLLTKITVSKECRWVVNLLLRTSNLRAWKLNILTAYVFWLSLFSTGFTMKK